MPRNVTQFDLLISCPSDVKEELEIIKETVADFNRMYGAANNTSIITKHWSTDSYPQSGGKPQNLLNEQFVLECDAAVAVFWTRFGTPTDNYGSGTEEEIEELINSGKQVFLYFSDRPINPASLDPKQYKKVVEFRERYKDRGIYAAYSDILEFKKNFLNHLSLYFVNLLTNGHQGENINQSSLSVKSVRNGKVAQNPIIYKRTYQSSKFIEDLKLNILSLFDKVKDIQIHEEIEEQEPQEPESYTQAIMNGSQFGNISLGLRDHYKEFNSIFSSVEITLQAELQNKIKSFAEKYNIEINYYDFFNIGKLSKRKQPFGGGTLGTEASYSLVGSDEEKEKYQLLKKLYLKIDEFVQWESYFEAIDSKFCIDLSLANVGTSYDEDIDIRLYVKSGHLCTGRQLPLPGNEILEKATQFIEPIFKPRKSLTVIEYDDYSNNLSVLPTNHPLYGFNRSYEEEVESNREEYLESIDEIFCYDYFQDGDYDVICYKQSYIKQNTNVYFPSIILFHSLPSSLHYEISSKFYPEVIKGELKPVFEND